MFFHKPIVFFFVNLYYLYKNTDNISYFSDSKNLSESNDIKNLNDSNHIKNIRESKNKKTSSPVHDNCIITTTKIFINTKIYE